MNRNLDGYYFRIKRDGKWDNICWSDMTDKERDEQMTNRSEEWLKSLCKGLGNVIHKIGEDLDIACEQQEIFLSFEDFETEVNMKRGDILELIEDTTFYKKGKKAYFYWQIKY